MEPHPTRLRWPWPGRVTLAWPPILSVDTRPLSGTSFSPRNPLESRAPSPGTALALGSVTVAHPRRITPGATYLVTRRCYQRTFRLRPSDSTNQIFLYCLALAMQKTGVRLHAVCVMSNHHHLVVTDPRGRIADFTRELHRLSAKSVNASQGQWENLWAAEPCNDVRLVTDEDVEEKIAYVVANPVAAGLVKDPEKWPGVLIWGERTLQVTRPTAYFSADGTCPVELTLVVEPPNPAAPDAKGTPSDWLPRLQRAIAEKVEAARQAIYDAGRQFLGAEAVLHSSFARSATSNEVKRGLVPAFAARLESVRDRLREVERGFRAAYRLPYRDWRKGMRDAVFPFGTWGMWMFHGATVDAGGPSGCTGEQFLR
jgi:putative transposase